MINIKPPRKNPNIYEINLRTWLHELAVKEGHEIRLSNIPASEFRRLKDLGMDMVWLMGMWQRSLYSRKRARKEATLVNEARKIIEDFSIGDIEGSPYAVFCYEPDTSFGTKEELKALKSKIEDEGLFLILDFVPNHTASDHPWTIYHPERYIHREPDEQGRCIDGFYLTSSSRGKVCIANGKDPYFPPWTDTAQINYSRSETRDAMVDELTKLSKYCHGFRCDMAMLVIKDVFQKTWGNELIGDWDGEEFWAAAVEKLSLEKHKSILIAESYWGKETELFKLGFDYAYDKPLYDLMISGDTKGIKKHLSISQKKQEKRVRFLENHDEPRAMKSFGRDMIKCAMVIHATLPGMKLWQHGQLDGNRIRIPVQLRRAPVEPLEEGLKNFSALLLGETNHCVFHGGIWMMLPTHGWPDNHSFKNLLCWCWKKDEHRRLVVVNFSISSSQGYVRLPDGWLPEQEDLLMKDPIKNEIFAKSTAKMNKEGLYVALGKYDFHFFVIERGRLNG